MKDQLISFDVAKLAKEKGFKEYCFAYFSISGEEKYFREDGMYYHSNGANGRLILRPTQSLLHKWLREEHGIYILIIPTLTSDWTFKTITIISKRDDDVISGLKSVSELPPYKNVNGYDYTTYELALEAGLLEALKMIK